MSHTRTSLTSKLVTLVLVAAGCVGNVGDAGPTGNGKPSPGNNTQPGQTGNEPGAPGTPNPGTQTPAPASVSAGVAPLRRLTAEQYRNTVRDLLGIKEDLGGLLLPGDDAIADRFLSNGSSALKGIDLDRYAEAAESLAKKAVANLGTLVPCDVKAADAGCAKRFIEGFGRRAYRRPLRGDEVARLEGIFAGAGGFAEGVELVLTAVLQSPKFLYLLEPVPADAAGKVVPVDPFALAARLSYFLLGTMPDDALLEAAEQGRLGTPDQVGAQAERLGKDARFAANVGGFHRQWLQLGEVSGAEKDAKLFPSFTAEVRTALAEESRRFVAHVMAQEEGKLEALLGAPYSLLSGPLYEYYGVPRPAGAAGDSWDKVTLPAGERAGILTHGSILAAQSHADKTSFILRGKLVSEAIFCTPIPPPPEMAANGEPELPPTATAKERAAAHRKVPSCASCHDLFDPLGFAFEIYDASGRFRKGDAQAIDAAVDLSSTRKLSGTVQNAVELAKKLATADEVKDCVARQWLRYALGRDDGADDAAALDAAGKAFRGSGKLSDLMAALARSDALRFQRVGSN